ncbi:unnamed protein product [Owenia fusiformis]|uniref:Uncharacterized protein n=1 Tax=Owenia fusiformis TaxID=6347 RepID=A0A8J1TXD8_OWEFU|nr:unnamed protein product [Owenia fusiformis]
MSTARGNSKKSGPPKHQNKSAYRNDMHSKSKQLAALNNMKMTELCPRCAEVIEWKIKFKKYKALTTAKKCTKCLIQKTVKRAYHIICDSCARKDSVCAKCGEKTGNIEQGGPSTSEQQALDEEFQAELRMLPERKRRTYLRLQAQGKLTGEAIAKIKDLDLTDDSEDKIEDFEDSEEDIENEDQDT